MRVSKRVVVFGLLWLAAVAGVAWSAGAARMAWSVVLAGAWLLANGWAITGLCRALLQTRRRWWPLIGSLVVKFPVLYGLGWAALVWLSPSAVGLAIGLTVALVVLLQQSLVVRHG